MKYIFGVSAYVVFITGLCVNDNCCPFFCTVKHLYSLYLFYNKYVYSQARAAFSTVWQQQSSEFGAKHTSSRVVQKLCVESEVNPSWFCHNMLMLTGKFS